MVEFYQIPYAPPEPNPWAEGLSNFVTALHQGITTRMEQQRQASLLDIRRRGVAAEETRAGATRTQARATEAYRKSQAEALDAERRARERETEVARTTAFQQGVGGLSDIVRELSSLKSALNVKLSDWGKDPSELKGKKKAEYDSMLREIGRLEKDLNLNAGFLKKKFSILYGELFGDVTPLEYLSARGGPVQEWRPAPPGPPGPPTWWDSVKEIHEKSKTQIDKVLTGWEDYRRMPTKEPPYRYRGAIPKQQGVTPLESLMGVRADNTEALSGFFSEFISKIPGERKIPPIEPLPREAGVSAIAKAKDYAKEQEKQRRIKTFLPMLPVTHTTTLIQRALTKKNKKVPTNKEVAAYVARYVEYMKDYIGSSRKTLTKKEINEQTYKWLKGLR